jgi:LacI family transcriptional regulator
MMNKPKNPTVADVAVHAGVSIGTVSNVLKGVIPVSARIRERVMTAIAELDYRQNMLAQGLRSKRAPIVGLCVPHTTITYFAELVDAFEEVASNNSFEIMQVLSRQDHEKEYQRVKSLLNYRVGGLIIVPTMRPEKTYELIRQSGIATVVVDRAPTGEFPFDRVTFDNHAAMRQAGEGLIQRGHRNILFVVHQRLLNVTVQRIAGLREAADACADKVTTNVIECNDQTALTAQLSAEMRRANRPTAIIVSNSRIATWAYRAFRALQLDCPKDVSLVAFDEPEWADIVTPSLSVVRQPTREIALMAWRFLLHRISQDVDGTQEIQLNADVIFRNSVADLTR